MQTTLDLAEARPAATVSTHDGPPPDIPLIRLRGYDRPLVTPETCRMPKCPICQWQREGLIPSVRSH